MLTRLPFKNWVAFLVVLFLINGIFPSEWGKGMRIESKQLVSKGQIHDHGLIYTMLESPTEITWHRHVMLLDTLGRTT